jgi:hypothetical protein
VENGRIILLVPAFQFLYGTIDRLVGHKRRYTKRSLKELLNKAGFIVEKIEFMNSLGILGWFLNNRILRRREESVSQVALYDRFFVPLIRRIEKIITPPFGLSIVAIARRCD